MQLLAAATADPLITGAVLLGAAVISIFINAVLLRVATRLIAKFWLEFKTALVASTLVNLCQFGLGFIVQTAADMFLPGDHMFALILSLGTLVVIILIAGIIYGKLIKDPDKYPESTAHIGFGKGLLLALLTQVTLLIIIFGIGALIFIFALGGQLLS